MIMIYDNVPLGWAHETTKTSIAGRYRWKKFGIMSGVGYDKDSTIALGANLSGDRVAAINGPNWYTARIEVHIWTISLRLRVTVAVGESMEMREFEDVLRRRASLDPVAGVTDYEIIKDDGSAASAGTEWQK